MRRGLSALAGPVLGVMIATSPALADVTGSFDGNLVATTVAATAGAAVFAQTGRSVIGTVALPADLPTFGGAYLVHGIATPKRLRLSGASDHGVRFKWRGKIVGDTIQGKARMKGLGAKFVGTLSFTRNTPPASDGSACDAVYTQNQSLFVSQVMGVALTKCTTCHAPGLQAAATRLHVTASDPLGTARAIALLVNPADPPASRILVKPLNLVPHGGGLQIMAGSTEQQILQQWVDLVVQAHCN
jgi:hypothetical protein